MNVEPACRRACATRLNWFLRRFGVTAAIARIAPFRGLFGTPQTASGAVLEVHTLIALVIYALVAWLVVRGAWLAFGEGRSASVARTDTVQTRAR